MGGRYPLYGVQPTQPSTFPGRLPGTFSGKGQRMTNDAWEGYEAAPWAAATPARRARITQPIPVLPRPGVDAQGSTFSPALAGAAEVVGLVRRLSDGQGRDDLVEQLDTIRQQLAVEPIPVVVMGGAGQGKSSLINALVGAAVVPVGTDGVTAAPIAVSHAPAYEAGIVIDPASSGRVAPSRRDVGYAEAISLANTAMNPDNQWALRLIELGVPSPTLDRGLVLIDTPPIHDVWSVASTRLLRAVSGAAAVILVTSAANVLTPGELDLLRTSAALCHRVIVVVNGTNAFPQWASVVERNQLLLEQRGVPAKVFAVAATPYWGDAGGIPPGPDAGMQALSAHLESSVVLDSEHTRISKALVETFWAADRLRMRLFAERTLMGDGQGIDDATGRLRQAARDAQDLCSPSATWHTLMVDGLRDLRRDIEQDLAAEMVRLTSEAEQHVASIGVTSSWDDVHLWTHRRLADAIVHVHRVRKLAIRGYCKRVADQFQQDWTRIVSTLDMASEAHALLNPRLDRPSIGGPSTLADVPIPMFGDTPVAPVLPSPLDASDPRAVAFGIYREWLAVTEQFLRVDTDDTLNRIASELELRCTGRGIELHRSIIEVFTTLNVLRDLDPVKVMARHEALESDLEQLRTLDFHLHHDDAQPKLGY